MPKILPLPSSKRADDEIFLAYVSNNFKAKKKFTGKKNCKKMLEFFSKYLVRFIAEMPLSANLFRLGSSIQKHAMSSGTAPVGQQIDDKFSNI